MSKLTPEQRALFEAKNFITVATVGKDGGPRATNVWVDIDDQERIVLNSAENRAWPRNLKRDRRVALNLFDMANPYKKITVLGHVDEITTDGAVEHINKLAHKYTGKDYVGDMDRVIFRIAIDKLHTYGV